MGFQLPFPQLVNRISSINSIIISNFIEDNPTNISSPLLVVDNWWIDPGFLVAINSYQPTNSAPKDFHTSTLRLPKLLLPLLSALDLGNPRFLSEIFLGVNKNLYIGGFKTFIFP